MLTGDMDKGRGNDMGQWQRQGQKHGGVDDGEGRKDKDNDHGTRARANAGTWTRVGTSSPSPPASCFPLPTLGLLSFGLLIYTCVYTYIYID